LPFRSYILERCFDEVDLRHLDPFGESEEDYHAEQREIRRAERQGSFDEEELIFPNRAEFRGGLVRTHQRRHTIGQHQDLETMVPTIIPIGYPSLHGDLEAGIVDALAASAHNSNKDSHLQNPCSGTVTSTTAAMAAAAVAAADAAGELDPIGERGHRHSE